MNRFDRLLQNLRIREVAPYVRAGDSVLDLGCADGALLFRIPRIGAYVGVDPDAPLHRSGGSALFVRGTFPNRELAGHEPFDVITALAVLEHVPQGGQQRFAEACARHLRKAGVLAITVPSKLVDPILDALMALGVLHGMETEQHYGFDPASTPALFARAGFALERHHRFELGLNHLFVFRKS